MNSNNRIAATLYSLGTYVVCLRNISINTLHKGDDDDDNNNNNLCHIVTYLFSDLIATLHISLAMILCYFNKYAKAVAEHFYAF